MASQHCGAARFGGRCVYVAVFTFGVYYLVEVTRPPVGTTTLENTLENTLSVTLTPPGRLLHAT